MKRLLSLLLVLALCLCLCACHGSKDIAGFTVPEAFDTSRQYEITFWAKNDTVSSSAIALKCAASQKMCIFTSYYH